MVSAAPFNPTRPGEVRWSEGFFHDLAMRGRTATHASIRAALWDRKNSATFANFKAAAAMKQRRSEGAKPTLEAKDRTPAMGEGSYQGTHWADGDCYKYVEGLCHLYGAEEKGDAKVELKKEIDELIQLIASAQEDDGYLNTQIQVRALPRWVTRIHHEDYNLGHLFTAAAVHRLVTGESSLLTVARRAADCAYGFFVNRRRDAGQFGWNPTHIPGLVDLSRATGDERYLELACIFLDHRGAERAFPVEAPDFHPADDENQMAVPLRLETEAVGHAVTAAYLYQGAIEIYRANGDESLREVARKLWEEIVAHKLYLTGAIGAIPSGLSKRGHRVWEAFGKEYELPHRSAYNETCANIAFALFSRSMLLAEADARYADALEQVVFNAGISGVSLDGREFCYANPLRAYREWQNDGTDKGILSNFSLQRWRIHSCYCCPPQLFRTIAQLQDWAYVTSPKTVSAVLYGSSRAKVEVPGVGKVALRQVTAYPWDGSVAITIEETPEAEWTLALRLPGWCPKPTLSIEGEGPVTVPPDAHGTFFRLTRKWKAGACVRLELPMPIRLIQANPKVEACRGQVAATRGPIVYCAESTDLPGGVPLQDVCIRTDFSDFAGLKRDHFGNLVTLHGPGRVRRSPPERLYASFDSRAFEELELVLIPYFAWNNRGPADMSVWLTWS
jgi:hypothetical protein